MFSCVLRGLKAQFAGVIYLSQLLKHMGALWTETQGTRPLLVFLMLAGEDAAVTTFCMVTLVRGGGETLIQSSSPLPLEAFLIDWQNCCSVAVMSPWPCVTVGRTLGTWPRVAMHEHAKFWGVTGTHSAHILEELSLLSEHRIRTTIFGLWWC